MQNHWASICSWSLERDKAFVIEERFNIMMKSQLDSLGVFLNGALRDFRRGSVPPVSGVMKIRDRLHEIKEASNQEEWGDCVSVCQKHPLFEIFQEDPICYRAHSRPRGYSGDAALLDMIYRRDYKGVDKREVTDFGGLLFSVMASCNAPHAVRTRAVLTGQAIDRLLSENGSANILSVASGHLEEFNHSELWHDSSAHIDALDQDENSLDEIARRFPLKDIDFHQTSITKLLKKSFLQKRYDFIYSNGLYDYLSDRMAARLTQSLGNRLIPSSGKLLVWNFHKSMRDRAFMDTMMDWKLVYRDEADLKRLATIAFGDSEQFDVRVGAGCGENLVFLEVTRNG